MRNKFLLAVVMMFVAIGSAWAQEGEATGTAYAVYCAGSGTDDDPATLYFLTSESVLNVGDTHNKQTITSVWSGDDVINTPTYVTEAGGPKWISTGKTVQNNLKNVVFEKSFKDVKPLSFNLWFFGCEKLSSIEGMENLNTESAKVMVQMFYGCKQLESIDLSHFNTGNVTDMSGMFRNCSSLKSLDLRSFNTEKVTSLVSMFDSCFNLTSVDLSSFNTGNVTYMNSMFYRCGKLKELDLSNFDTKKVDNMSSMFSGCKTLTTLDLSSFNTASLLYMNYMFNGCSNLISIDLSSFNTSSTETKKFMNSMFYSCSSLKYIAMSDDFVINEDESKDMYKYCNILTPCAVYCETDKSLHFLLYKGDDLNSGTTITVDGKEITLTDSNFWKEKAVTSTGTEALGWSALKANVKTVVFADDFKYVLPLSCNQWFAGCKNLTSLNLNNLNLKNVTDMSSMFSACNNLQLVDLSSATRKVADVVSEISTDLVAPIIYVNVSENTEGIANTKNVIYGNVGSYTCDNLVIDKDGISQKKLIVSEEFTAKKITIERNFKAGNPHTLYLPFEMDAKEYGTFYTFTKYDSDTKNVLFNKLEEDKTTANTPIKLLDII